MAPQQDVRLWGAAFWVNLSPKPLAGGHQRRVISHTNRPAITLHLEHRDQAAGFYSPLARFWELLVGAILACSSRAPAASKPRRAVLKIDGLLAGLIYKKPMARAGLTLGHLLSGVGIIIVVLAIFTFRERPTWPGHWAITPVVGVALVIAAGRSGFFNRWLLANPPAVAIGLISYPLYLWHWPILAYLRILNGGPPAIYHRHRVLALLTALVLAGLTYKLVERPFRFGPRFRDLKVLVLTILLTLVAGVGLFTYIREGLPGRGVKSPGYKTTPKIDKACQAYTGISYADFSSKKITFLCRFSGGHGPTTVALIGNSHAWSTYFGVEKFNALLGFNTLLLARGTIPLLVGTEALIENDDELKDSYRELLFRSFEVLKREEIKFVFISIMAERLIQTNAYPYLQPTIDELTKAGKKVFLVVNWPKLPRRGVDYAIRPFSKFFTPEIAAEHRELDRNLLLKNGVYWREYFQLLQSLKNVSIIDGTWDAFCPGSECLVFSETGQLLYSDNRHLTNAGSEFLTEKVLAPYLSELADF